LGASPNGLTASALVALKAKHREQAAIDGEPGKIRGHQIEVQASQ
jgi:hypothetical protein